MNFVYIEESAVKSIVSNARFQSYEFEEGRYLAEFFKYGNIERDYYSGIFFEKTDDGFYLFSEKPNLKHSIIFDYNYFKGFVEKRGEDIITILQKVLRFAVKVWDNMNLSACEKWAPIGDKIFGIVFPFPWVATRGAYRVIIQKNPLGTRESKRNMTTLLVLNDVTSEQDVQPNYALYRKVVDNASGIVSIDNQRALTVAKGSEPLGIYSLTEVDARADLFMNNDDWQYRLTGAQKKFIEKPLTGKPERLEGAAGTGKTISMVLKCISILKSSIANKESKSILFLTHSEASKKLIKELLEVNFPEAESYYDRNYSSASITIETLQGWCLQNLNMRLSEVELLDRDAQDSKFFQLLKLEEAYEEAWSKHYSTYKPLLSTNFITFLEDTNKEHILEMIQFEISTMIKGRAAENIDKYKRLTRLKYSIPTENEFDLKFIFLIYQRYQQGLSAINVFDTDDIVLSSLNQLDSPIWRRRKEIMGYDVIFIDETHLFNINELSVIHYLLKVENDLNIIFAIDKAQAVGDRGLSDDILGESMFITEYVSPDISVYQTVFRCSPDIVNLAYSILASGASLFTHFENPLQKMQYSFSHSEEQKAKIPQYSLFNSDDIIVEESLRSVDLLCQELNVSRSKIVIIATDGEILKRCESFMNSLNKPIDVLKARSDRETIKAANRANKYLLAHIDYVGGLEFDAAIIIGVDKSRVPPSEIGDESRHFLSYAWHNRMYVAITRAKFRIIIYGEISRGVSPLLENAITNRMVEFSK